MVMQIRSLSDPLRSILDLERELNDIMGSNFGMSMSSDVVPVARMNVAEYDDRTEVIAELPGIAKDELHIAVHDGILALEGERKHPSLPEKARWINQEIPAWKFVRRVNLQHPVKLDAVTAELSNGVLRVVLPKTEEALPREIAVGEGRASNG